MFTSCLPLKLGKGLLAPLVLHRLINRPFGATTNLKKSNMKKIKLTLLTNLLVMMAVTSATSQNWIKHGTGLVSPSGVCVVDISAPSPSIAWGILSVFSAGSCGGQVPYFTKTVNGINWAAGTIALPANHTPVCISALSASTAWIATADISTNTSGSIYKTSNGGVSWQQQTSANFIDAARFVHFFDSNQGVAVGDSSVFITTNGGVNWVFNGALPVPQAIVGGGTTQFLLNAYEVLGNTIWLGDVYGNFYKSTNQGVSWTVLPNCIYHSVKGIAFRDQNYGIAVASEYIGGGSGSSGGTDADSSVFTTDGGITWSPMPIELHSLNVDDGSAKYDVGYVPGTANTFIVTSEYDSVYAAFSAISVDGGMHWTLLDSTEQHTVCAFTGSNSGFTGGYINTSTRGIYTLTGTLPTEVKVNVEQSSIVLYPNPANEFIEISQLPQSCISCLQVSIHGMDGKLWIREKLLNQNTFCKINLASLPRGSYVLSIQQEATTIMTYKLIH